MHTKSLPEIDKAFIDEFKAISRKHQHWRVWQDFCEMAALSLANSVRMVERREQRYLDIVKAYERDDVERFCRMLALTVEALECGGDFLGRLFMALELGSHWKGQYFTPWEVSRLMAEVSIGDSESLAAQVERQGFITVSDPACGAGVMLIAFAEAVAGKGINFQQCVHVTAQDIDPTAAHMCYIQLSLLGVPGQVVIGNSLATEAREVFDTPMHWIGGWPIRLRSRARREQRAVQATTEAAVADAGEAMPLPMRPLPSPVADIELGQMALDF